MMAMTINVRNSMVQCAGTPISADYSRSKCTGLYQTFWDLNQKCERSKSRTHPLHVAMSGTRLRCDILSRTQSKTQRIKCRFLVRIADDRQLTTQRFNTCFSLPRGNFARKSLTQPHSISAQIPPALLQLWQSGPTRKRARPPAPYLLTSVVTVYPHHLHLHLHLHHAALEQTAYTASCCVRAGQHSDLPLGCLLGCMTAVRQLLTAQSCHTLCAKTVLPHVHGIVASKHVHHAAPALGALTAHVSTHQMSVTLRPAHSNAYA